MILILHQTSVGKSVYCELTPPPSPCNIVVFDAPPPVMISFVFMCMMKYLLRKVKVGMQSNISLLFFIVFRIFYTRKTLVADSISIKMSSLE